MSRHSSRINSLTFVELRVGTYTGDGRRGATGGEFRERGQRRHDSLHSHDVTSRGMQCNALTRSFISD